MTDKSQSSEAGRKNTSNGPPHQDLLTAVDQGPVYFNDSTNQFLSNEFPSEFTVEGTTFNSVEQFLQAAKAMLYGDLESYDRIMEEDAPFMLKMLGSQVDVKDHHTFPYPWEYNTNRFNATQKGIRLKFEQSKDAKTLQDQLVATQGRKIVYLSTDDYWGIGTDTTGWHVSECRGYNNLGKLLDAQREKIIKEREKEQHASQALHT